jgi:hypothetical protein
MAIYKIYKEDEDRFFDSLTYRDFELIEKLIDSIIYAINNKKKKIDAFEVIFSDSSSLIFTITHDNYKECLENCIDDFSKRELFEKCIEIKKLINTL